MKATRWKWLCRLTGHALNGGPTVRTCRCGSLLIVDGDDPEAVPILRIRAASSEDPYDKATYQYVADVLEERGQRHG